MKNPEHRLSYTVWIQVDVGLALSLHVSGMASDHSLSLSVSMQQEA